MPMLFCSTCGDWVHDDVHDASPARWDVHRDVCGRVLRWREWRADVLVRRVHRNVHRVHSGPMYQCVHADGIHDQCV